MGFLRNIVNALGLRRAYRVSDDRITSIGVDILRAEV